MLDFENYLALKKDVETETFQAWLSQDHIEFFFYMDDEKQGITISSGHRNCQCLCDNVYQTILG